MTASDLWPFVVIFVGIVWMFTGSFLIGGILLVIGIVPLAQRWVRNSQAEVAERNAAAQAAAEKQKAEAEERAFKEQETAMEKSGAFQRLHTQINELLDYAHTLKRGEENRIPVQAMMEVVGRIAVQHDLDDSFFAHEGIRSDVRLFFDALKRAGLEDDMLYQRAVRVLHAKFQLIRRVLLHRAPHGLVDTRAILRMHQR